MWKLLRCIYTSRLNRTSALRAYSMDGQFSVVKEGKAEALFPDTNEVFYNPVQEFNRDLTIAVIRLYGEELLKKRGITVCYDGASQITDGTAETEADPSENVSSTATCGKKCKGGLKILEALSASGLRSVRFAKEIAGIEEIVANDLSPQAVINMKRNIEHNQVGHLVTPSEADATLLMYQHRGSVEKTFDVVDIDPYGSAGLFIDPAVQAVRSGGLLCVTCTDMAVLCGNYGETCYAKYGAYSVKNSYSHEQALRIVLQCIETSAVRYGKHIEPILALSVDFYVRLFVRIHANLGQTKHSASKLAVTYICSGCESFHIQRLGKVIIKANGSPKFSAATGPPTSGTCADCGFMFHIAGPLWANPIHDVTFVKKLIDHVITHSSDFNTSARLQGMLTVASEEIPDAPFYYPISKVCNVIHCQCPPQVKFRSALLNAGYQASSTHTCAEAIKTDAPSAVIWDVLRAWEKITPVKRVKLSEGSPAFRILSKEPSLSVSFELHPLANPPSRKLNLKRFQVNPSPYWGPKARAMTGKGSENVESKKKRNQGKKSKGQDQSETELSSETVEVKEPDSKVARLEKS